MNKLELNFKGRVVLITGAATGIGRATALVRHPGYTQIYRIECAT